MKIPIYQVDAFTDRLFGGNPAAVCILEKWLDPGSLQAIATENNHSETAFLVRQKDFFELRWFTPSTEVDLCGHATLASAFIAFNYLRWPWDTVRFQTRVSGVLTVKTQGELLEMDFPARPPFETETPPGLAEALCAQPKEVFGSEEDLLVVFESAQAVRELKPDFPRLQRIEWRGVIATAPGEDCDFVSRFFGPQVGINEDPVTGSAHCVLTPFWSKRLGKRELRARQVSSRGGDLLCVDRGSRVAISGRAVLYLEGAITV